MVDVLDKGSIELINFMGGDEAVVAAARVSNGALYAESSKGPDKDARLIRFLMKHGHTSPFEHSVFTFYIKCPIFVAREWHRHRTWSYNEVSGRYTEFNREYYVPEWIRVPDSKNKQKSVFLGNSSTAISLSSDMRFVIDSHAKESYRVYEQLLSLGVARELARLVLPVNYYTSFYGTVNAHNLMKFIKLRNTDEAQWEIHSYAETLHYFLHDKMPITSEAFDESNG